MNRGRERQAHSSWGVEELITEGGALVEDGLPSEVELGAFGLHPALLDAVLHALAAGDESDAAASLPFSWTGVTLHATGAGTVRARLTPVTGGFALAVTDERGLPVLTVDVLALRPIPDSLSETADDGLYTVDWAPVELPAPGGHVQVILGADHPDLAALSEVPDFVVLPVPTPPGDGPAAALAATRDVLAVLREWVADERFASSRLVVVTGNATDLAAVAAQLAALPAERRLDTLLDPVRGQAAAVLGFSSAEDVDEHRKFLEHGFDSLTTLELHNRINVATGLRLPVSVLFEHATPDALARHLDGELGAAGASAPVAGPITALYQTARESGRLGEIVDVLVAAARLRPVFTTAAELDPRPAAVGLGTSGAGDAPLLVCLPSVLATSGPHQFARFAAGLRDRRDVTALSLPGFRATEPLPASLDAVAQALAEVVLDAVGARTYALVGYSSGGLLANAVAAVLERRGVPPRALVLLDTFVLGENLETLPGLLDGMSARLTETGLATDERLTAMGGYLRLLAGYEPVAVSARVLLVNAGLGRWPDPHETVDLPGDHFKVLEDHAEHTPKPYTSGWALNEALTTFNVSNGAFRAVRHRPDRSVGRGRGLVTIAVWVKRSRRSWTRRGRREPERTTRPPG